MSRGKPRPDVPDGAALAERIRRGFTMDDLAAEYGCSTSMIYKRIRAAGCAALSYSDKSPAYLPPRSRHWVEDALCAQVDPEIFHPEKGGDASPAKRVCMRCPVRRECLEEALATGERFGVRGGLSERERRKLQKNRGAA